MNNCWLASGFLVCYSVIISLLYQTFDFGYAISWIKTLVFVYSSIFVILLYKRLYGDDALIRLISDIVVASVISGIIMIVFFISPQVRELTNGYIVGTIANSWVGERGLRAYDLSVGGGTAYGLFNLIVIIILYRFKRILSPKTRVLVFLVLVSVIFLSARSVFLVTILLGFLALLSNIFHKSLYILLLRVSIFSIIFFTIISIAVYNRWGATFIGIEFIDRFADSVIPWAFELFINIGAGDGFRTATTDYILQEFFVPETDMGMFFGFGESNPASDSGFVRTVFSVGIFGLFIHLAIVFLFWRNLIFFSNSRDGKFIVTFVFALVLIFNFKELIFSNNRGLFGIIVLISYAFIVMRPVVYRVPGRVCSEGASYLFPKLSSRAFKLRSDQRRRSKERTI